MVAGAARRDLLTTLPGEFAGASLKHGRGAGRGRRGLSSPRRIRRGLIEAVVELLLVAGGNDSPRRIRRGLIEAPAVGCLRSVAWGASPRRIRRGLIEALCARRAGLRRKPSPRRIRRGLIEAWPVPAHPSPRPALPGEFAGASLKHRHQGCGQGRRELSPANSPGPH